MPLEIRQVAKNERMRQAAAILDIVELGAWGSKFAHELSGGMQQRVGLARALAANPDVLLMDEPSMGLSPLLVDQQFELIQKVNQQGTTIFMVEQNANMALSIADRGYVLQTGSIVLSDSASNLLCNEMMQEAYLGGADVCETPR